MGYAVLPAARLSM